MAPRRRRGVDRGCLGVSVAARGPLSAGGPLARPRPCRRRPAAGAGSGVPPSARPPVLCRVHGQRAPVGAVDPDAGGLHGQRGGLPGRGAPGAGPHGVPAEPARLPPTPGGDGGGGAPEPARAARGRDGGGAVGPGRGLPRGAPGGGPGRLRRGGLRGPRRRRGRERPRGDAYRGGARGGGRGPRVRRDRVRPVDRRPARAARRLACPLHGVRGLPAAGRARRPVALAPVLVPAAVAAVLIRLAAYSFESRDLNAG